jgi:charged multivesicular body protein 6
LQLAVESLPYAPVTEVRLEEKTKAPADTEAAPEDIDDVIELPDVPTKVPERPEAPEKTKVSISCYYPILYFYQVPFLVYMVH